MGLGMFSPAPFLCRFACRDRNLTGINGRWPVLDAEAVALVKALVRSRGVHFDNTYIVM